MERRKDHAPPAHWQDFEDLCLKLWRPRLIDAKKNGRSGQPQAGVDIVGRDPKTEAWVGIQCKQRGRWPKKVLTTGEIEAEVEQAEGFEPKLSHFIVATTAARDVEAQRFVRELSDRRRAEGKFTLDLFAWDDIQDLLQEQVSSGRKPEVSIAKLPSTGEHFVAREAELARLDAAWADPAMNVISFVAMGGAGKSALVNEWLDRLAADGWRGAARVLGWSFYSQGTEAVGASSEAFTEFALDWLGYEGEVITSPWKKGEVIARLVRTQRTLVVLDGLEPLQHPPGGQTGRIKDPPVQALVKELAALNPGLCLISTRLAVADIAGRAGTVAVDLEKLPSVAGAELLHRLGVRGSEPELRQASEEFGGHGLALSLLGTYLRDVCAGDVRRRHEVPLLDPEIEQGGHARRVMESYERWLGEGPELRVLRLIGLYDRPAEVEALAALRMEPAIPGLTDGLATGDEIRWRKALARLRRARLLAQDDSSGSLDVHPLVREHFGERLRNEEPEAWRAGHESLYKHYQQATDELPETLEAMLPLYAAVVHGCRAGRVREAFTEILIPRIDRNHEMFSLNKLGAFGAQLSALASFFERPWDRLKTELTALDQAWVLNAVAFVLHALGRLPEAVEPYRMAMERCIDNQNWKNAAASAGNLSELMLTLGKVRSAVQVGKKSVELADRSDDAFQRMSKRTTLADALHQEGLCEESAVAFREAEAMHGVLRPQTPRLTSVGSYRYCDLLLATAEPEDGAGLDGIVRGRHGAAARYRKACEKVCDRADYAIKIAEANDWLLDIALNQLSLGCAHLGLALIAQPRLMEAVKSLDRAVDGLRRSGQDQEIPRGFLARASLHRLRAALANEDTSGVHQDTSGTDIAASDLREAQEIAVRGQMRLYEADIHLEWTRLRLQTNDHGGARRHLEQARELVTACGYGRREREVAWLSSKLEQERGTH